MTKFIRENYLLFLSLLYLISPFDFLPEGLLGPLGLVDDLALVLLLLAKAWFARPKGN